MFEFWRMIWKYDSNIDEENHKYSFENYWDRKQNIDEDVNLILLKQKITEKKNWKAKIIIKEGNEMIGKISWIT